jgi:sarcosine oxidase delta subunit
MTGTYEWNPMPHRVDVRCPSCAAHARFEFAEAVRISRKADVPFFEQSRFFDYEFVERREHGQSYHAAIFCAGIHGTDTLAIKRLPDGYDASQWNHSRYAVRSHSTTRGAVVCPACGLRRRHDLMWPTDAWFQCEVRGDVLWAFHRESTIALRDFVASKKRKRSRWSSFLLHVPTVFLTANVRDEVVAKLDGLLAVSAVPGTSQRVARTHR